MDIFPMAPGHVLLIPRDHFSDLMELSAELSALMGGWLPKLSRAVKSATGAEGVNLISAAGKAAGQEVFHVHFHLLPRWTADGMVRLGGSRGRPQRDELDGWARRIAEAATD